MFVCVNICVRMFLKICIISCLGQVGGVAEIGAGNLRFEVSVLVCMHYCNVTQHFINPCGEIVFWLDSWGPLTKAVAETA